ncbi:MAG: aminotransferase class V [Trebouxia sp. A1-2]|nr:MAG: aminotransferase class V [Trebouxia sp. A1-2]
MPDWARIRADTPAAEKVLHFNNAGSALPTQQVTKAQHAYLELEATTGGYEALIQEAEAMEKPYTALAQLLNCHPDEIAITTSSTASWFQVFGGLNLKAGDRILTSVSEYGSNFLAYLQAIKRQQVQVEIIPEDAEGDVDIAALEKLVAAGASKPALIALTHIPTSSGRHRVRITHQVYTHAAAAGAIAQREGIPYLLDATQSIGQMPIDVQQLQCDYLTSTGRKFLRAPRGTGLLYASRAAMAKAEPAMVDVHGAVWSGRHDYKLMGLGVAAEYVLEIGIEAIWERVQHISGMLRQQLQELQGVTVQDRGRLLCGIVSFTMEGKRPEDVKQELREKNINVSISPANSTLLDFSQRGLTKVLRASVHYYNTEEEVHRFIKTLKSL